MEEQEDFPSENVGRVYKKSDRSIVQGPTESVKFPPFFFKNSRLNISSNEIILNEIPFKEIGPR